MGVFQQTVIRDLFYPQQNKSLLHPEIQKHCTVKPISIL